MDMVLIIVSFLIVLLLLWTFFGSSSDEKVESSEETGKKPERIFRRRATDREIEEEFPDDEPRRRRRSDLTPEKVKTEADTSFKLPYLADDIISDTSRFRIYKRTLKNSEIYAVKGDFSTAISLYAGVHERVNDLDTRYKIESNIEYLKNYKEHKKEVHQRRKDDALKKQNEVKFKVDGHMPDQISIGVIDQEKLINTNEIAQKVISQIKEDLESEGILKQEKQELENLKGGLHDLNDQIKDLKRNMIPDSSGQPALTEAKYDKPIPLSIDPKPILDLLEKLPGGKDSDTKAKADASAEASPAKESLEKKIHKNVEEDDDDFELLSEYGKEKSEDELSDEEIFEKILKETKDESDTASFEIIGDQRDEEEMDILDKNHEARMKEEENFYRNLIKTDRRMKKELPILKVSYDFSRLPDEFSLSREQNILEYSFYKYKPMLEKAIDFIKRRRVREAINYYKVIMAQNIPPEFKSMIRQNIRDLTEYLEKYLASD